MNFFIFGGSGFIGRHLAQQIQLSHPNSLIYILDLAEYEGSDNNKFISCDVRLPISFEAEFTKHDVIFNLAAIHRTPGHPDYDYFETNIRGAENICTFAAEKGIKKIVFTSSIAPYGASESIKTEGTLPTPNTPYGISKLVAEKILQTWQIEDKTRNLLILRPGVVFGKGENGNFTRLYWALKKNQFFYPGRKDTIKASIYVKDLIGFALSQVNNMEYNYSQIYNCTYHPAYNIEVIVNTISKITKVRSPKLLIPSGLMINTASAISLLGGKKLGIHPDRVKKLMISTNISGEKMALSGYKFQYGFEDGIKDWFADNQNQYLQ